MREIKFRAWNDKAKSWAKWEDNFIGQDGKLHIKGNNDLILEQFTGLLDSKGREIYEGDRIKYGKHGEAAYNCMVEYDAPEFIVLPDLDIISCSPLSLVGYHGWYCEVIGNIHESE